MKYLKFTLVDSITGISVASEPARNGPAHPPVVGLEFFWARESAYPTDVPELFGTCPDDSSTQIDGVLDIYAEEVWLQMRDSELNLRKPKKISPRQIRQALTKFGLRTKVEMAVAAGDQETKDWYEFSTVFERGNPQVLAMAAALGVDDAQLDELWALGASL